MTKFIASLIVPLALAQVACSDRTAPEDPVPTPEPAGVVISSAMSISTTPGSEVSGVSGSGGQIEVAYVSIAPQTYPDATYFEIRNRTTASVVQSFAANDGGLDPIPIPARAGDVLDVTIRRATNTSISLTLGVPVRRPPVVVRTNPAKGRVDVALNVNVSVVFSEPIEPRSLDTASIQLRHDGVPSNGNLRLSDNALIAEFAPDNPLLPLATYELLVTQRVRDLNGDSLAVPYSSTFTTCPYYAIPSSCPPFPTGGGAEITGVVSERTAMGTTPLANVTVFAWVQYANGNGYSRGGVQSDANGHFRVDGLPNAWILLEAAKEGYDHPCGSYTYLGGASAVINLEVVSRAHPLPDAATAPPAISGVVYEITPGGRQPVAGARVFFDAAEDLIAAITTTDENGRYAVCSLPAVWKNETVYAVKDGYETAGATVSVSLAAQQLDIELKPAR